MFYLELFGKVFVNGNIYIADNNNNRISKWSSSGNAIGWIGNGSDGWKITNGAISDYQSFYWPKGIFVDSNGDIFSADQYNYRISKWKD